MRMFQQIYTNNKSVLVLSFVYDFVGTTLYAVNVNDQCHYTVRQDTGTNNVVLLLKCFCVNPRLLSRSPQPGFWMSFDCKTFTLLCIYFALFWVTNKRGTDFIYKICFVNFNYLILQLQLQLLITINKFIHLYSIALCKPRFWF